jgi:hypothetical protein
LCLDRPLDQVEPALPRIGLHDGRGVGREDHQLALRGVVALSGRQAAAIRVAGFANAAT